MEVGDKITTSGLILLGGLEDAAFSKPMGRVIRVTERVETFSGCLEVEFKNVAGFDENFLYNSKFTILKGESVNDCAVYGNGKDYLSYIEKGVGGAWIVGATPGEDRGYAYADIEYRSNTPAGVSGWHWLQKTDWERHDDVRVECSSGATLSRLYSIELINEDGILERGILNASENKRYLTLELNGVIMEVAKVKSLYEIGEEVALPGEGVGTLSKIEEASDRANGNKGWDLIFNLQEGGESRVFVPVDMPGDEDEVTWSRLPPSDKGDDVGRTIAAAREGQYLWVFYEGPTLPHSSTRAAVVAVREVLLVCVSQGVFRAFPSERKEAMLQEPLSADVDLILALGDTLMGPDGSNISAISCRNLGGADDVVRGLQRHLAAVERTPSASRLPACFFYHSSHTLPASLVYAAEIVCLMMGAKPVVMIQYATPSEHQWKFPLVQSLVRAIAATIFREREQSAVGMRVFTYRRDKTLLLYNKQREYLVHALAPKHQSQGLHPVPYPDESAGDTEQLQEEYRLQVYNSFWNGYVLGYPLHFVTTYCEDFHNPLTRDRKRRIANEAHEEVEELFRRKGLHPVKIGMGLDEPLSDTVIDAIYRSIAGSS